MIYERPCSVCNVLTLVCFGRDFAVRGQPVRFVCDLCIEAEEREENRANEQFGPLHIVEGWR